MISKVVTTRYVTPLREGGSLPAIVDADDGNQYVMKFVGAGQGPKALIAELIAGEIARALKINMPELAIIELGPMIGRSEPDPEIQDLLQASVGSNLGLRYLPNSLNFDPTVDIIDPLLASTIVWLDAFITNVDRTVRNVNMLMHQAELWVIDHGASLYFHHGWGDYMTRSQSPFSMIKDHVLLGTAIELAAADEIAKAKLSPTLFTEIVNQVPEVWLGGESHFKDIASHRQAYVEYLTARLDASSIFVTEAQKEHASLE